MKAFAQSLLSLWKQLGLNQRVSLALAAVVVVAGFAALILWSRRPDYQLLYGRLGEKDAAGIISQLETQNIPHQVAAGGGAVYVPADQVYRLRMELAAKGLPSGDGVGFEIFDKGQFGLSDFVQRTNYLRALQGELSRTISELHGVRSARVMIVQPENRLLLTDQGVKPTASVFIELASNRLEPESVNAIRNLVANSVQGLQPDQVAVVDNQGHVLSEDLKQDPALGSAANPADGEMVRLILQAATDSAGRWVVSAQRASDSVPRDRDGAGQSGPSKLVPEGIEGMGPYKGALTDFVFQLIGGLLRRQAFGFAHFDHRRDIVVTHLLGVDDLDIRRQIEPLIAGDFANTRGIPQQHAVSDALFVADDGGPQGARLVAFRQHDAFVGAPRAEDKTMTEGRGRQAQFARLTDRLLEQCRIGPLGDQLDRLLHPLRVVSRHMAVQTGQLDGGAIGVLFRA